MPGISCRWLRWRSGTGSCRTSFNVSCRFPRSRELRARPQLGVAAGVRRRIVELHAEALGGVPDPARVVEERARHGDHVGLAGSDDLLGLLGVGDHPYRPHVDVDRFFYVRGVGHLVARLDLDARMREKSGARHADVVEADALQLACVDHRVVGPEPALGPVVRADARAERTLLRPGFPYCGRHFERKLASVGPIGVFSLVRKRRQELVQEIAVRRMKLEHVEADALDRKSTRLNSSHGYISYAVFCLKKKN